MILLFITIVYLAFAFYAYCCLGLKIVGIMLSIVCGAFIALMMATGELL